MLCTENKKSFTDYLVSRLVFKPSDVVISLF